MKKGKFFVFEGIDGSGKTFQVNEFAKRLKRTGVDVVATKEPWYEDSIGTLIKKALYDKKESMDVRTMQLLYVANRSNHVTKVVSPAIAAGKTVVCSRYWMTTAVYGNAFFKEYSIDMKYFIKINEIFPTPDAVFYIDVNPKEAYRRLSLQRQLTDRFEKLNVIKTQSEKYRELEAIYKKNKIGAWANINGNQEKEKVSDEIMRYYGRLK